VSVNRFIGRGWRFPIKVNARGGFDWSEGPDRVRDAIWIVVKTALGERLMRPEFGAAVDTFVFQPNSAATRAELSQSVSAALVRWEPRIELDAVRVDEVPGEPSQVMVAIDYRLRDTNELFNLVVPFYLEEGVS
jgi:phage baseplate assembly protein W